MTFVAGGNLVTGQHWQATANADVVEAGDADMGSTGLSQDTSLLAIDRHQGSSVAASTGMPHSQHTTLGLSGSSELQDTQNLTALPSHT